MKYGTKRIRAHRSSLTDAMRSLLVTGGAGFIGSNFVRYYLEAHPGVRLVNFDKLTYAGNLDNLRDIAENGDYAFVRGDICSRDEVLAAMKKYETDAVVHFAAESHVDRSISGAAVFVATNVLGTQVLAGLRPANGRSRSSSMSRRTKSTGRWGGRGSSPSRPPSIRTARTPRARPLPTCLSLPPSTRSVSPRS